MTWREKVQDVALLRHTGIGLGTTSVVFRTNWNDTEKISMAPAQEFVAQTKIPLYFLTVGVVGMVAAIKDDMIVLRHAW